MEPVLQSQIFFFITSIFVVILTVVLIVAGFYIIRILRNFRDISDTFKDGVENAGEEIAEMAEHVRESPVFEFIFGRSRKEKVRSTRRRTPKS